MLNSLNTEQEALLKVIVKKFQALYIADESVNTLSQEYAIARDNCMQAQTAYEKASARLAQIKQKIKNDRDIINFSDLKECHRLYKIAVNTIQPSKKSPDSKINYVDIITQFLKLERAPGVPGLQTIQRQLENLGDKIYRQRNGNGVLRKPHNYWQQILQSVEKSENLFKAQAANQELMETNHQIIKKLRKTIPNIECLITRAEENRNRCCETLSPAGCYAYDYYSRDVIATLRQQEYEALHHEFYTKLTRKHGHNPKIMQHFKALIAPMQGQMQIDDQPKLEQDSVSSQSNKPSDSDKQPAKPPTESARLLAMQSAGSAHPSAQSMQPPVGLDQRSRSMESARPSAALSTTPLEKTVSAEILAILSAEQPAQPPAELVRPSASPTTTLPPEGSRPLSMQSAQPPAPQSAGSAHPSAQSMQPPVGLDRRSRSMELVKPSMESARPLAKSMQQLSLVPLIAQLIGESNAMQRSIRSSRSSRPLAKSMESARLLIQSAGSVQPSTQSSRPLAAKSAESAQRSESDQHGNSASAPPRTQESSTSNRIDEEASLPTTTSTTRTPERMGAPESQKGSNAIADLFSPEDHHPSAITIALLTGIFLFLGTSIGSATYIGITGLSWATLAQSHKITFITLVPTIVGIIIVLAALKFVTWLRDRRLTLEICISEDRTPDAIISKIQEVANVLKEQNNFVDGQNKRTIITTMIVTALHDCILEKERGSTTEHPCNTALNKSEITRIIPKPSEGKLVIDFLVGPGTTKKALANELVRLGNNPPSKTNSSNKREGTITHSLVPSKPMKVTVAVPHTSALLISIKSTMDQIIDKTSLVTARQLQQASPSTNIRGSALSTLASPATTGELGKRQ